MGVGMLKQQRRKVCARVLCVGADPWVWAQVWGGGSGWYLWVCLVVLVMDMYVPALDVWL